MSFSPTKFTKHVKQKYFTKLLTHDLSKSANHDGGLLTRTGRPSNGAGGAFSPTDDARGISVVEELESPEFSDCSGAVSVDGTPGPSTDGTSVKGGDCDSITSVSGQGARSRNDTLDSLPFWYLIKAYEGLTCTN